MRHSASTRGVAGRLSLVLLAMALLAPATVLIASTDAAAQEVRRGRTLFDLLFNRDSRRAAPVEEPLQEPRPRVRRQSSGGAGATTPGAAAPSTPQPEAVAKNEDAKVLLVIGDFMGGGLGEGLDAAFAQNPAIRVVTRQNGSSGFVRDDFYDWSAEIGPILDETKPAAVAVMLGSNDRQQMTVDGNRETVRSDAWTKAYDSRVRRLAKAIRDRGLPLVWVGLPAFKSSAMSADMIAFNDIYRSTAEEVGGEFVDIWDGFVDENGVFTTVGPDINGQRVRLRGSDGINLTAAGKRKVAFYAERSLNKIFETGGAAIASRGPASAMPSIDPSEQATPRQIERTQPISLADPALDDGSRLMGAVPAPRRPDMSDGAASASALPSRPGRADDFALRPAQAAAPDRNQTTTAIP